MITFLITTNKQREHNITPCVDNIQMAFPDAEIIILNQVDGLAFKKGQMYNMGVRLASNEQIAFIDNDFRFLSDSNLELIYMFKEYGKYNTGILPFNTIIQLKESVGSNVFERIDNNDMVCKGAGGLFLMSKDDYAKAHGHSNLYFGYGYEDLSFPIRVGKKFIRLNGTMGHIWHDNPHDEYMKQPMFKMNKDLWQTERHRDNSKDSWNHTCADVTFVEHNADVVEYQYSNISVNNDFGYSKLYLKQMVNEKYKEIK